MSRVAVLAVAVVSAGCATAGKPGNVPVDALVPPATIDAPALPIDAPREIDAPVPSVDAPAQTCATTVTCATATVLPGIGGDETGASTSGGSGYQAEWYSIRVSETDNGPLADPMSMRVTLTSPSDAMFDLLVYLPADASSTDCTTPTGTVTTSGATQTWAFEWGETGTLANGEDDSRSVSIQISPQGADSCSPSAIWSMSIQTGLD